MQLLVPVAGVSLGPRAEAGRFLAAVRKSSSFCNLASKRGGIMTRAAAVSRGSGESAENGELLAASFILPVELLLFPLRHKTVVLPFITRSRRR